MSQIAGIAEGDSAGRASYLSLIDPQLKVIPSQNKTNWNQGPLDIACAAAKNAPVSSAASDNGAGAFVLGRWSEEKPGTVSEAQRVLDACNTQGGQAVAKVASYGVACFVEPSGAVWIGTDTLGLYPLYFHADAHRLVFSSSPALVAAHAQFKREFNVRGLVGNLLTMQMVGGQTLWKGIRRLAPGHALLWNQNEGAREIPANVLIPGEAHFGETYEQGVDRFDAAFDKAVRIDAAEDTTATLLSGGLDSRLIVAYLRRALRRPVHCITLGDPNDLEMRTASRVARQVGWPQHATPVDWSRYLSFAETHLTHMQLAHGFNDLAFWYAGDTAAQHATRLYTGIMGDCVMGGTHIPFGFDAQRQTYTWDAMFKNINRYGFRPEVIREIIRPEVLGDSLEPVLADLREPFDSCPGLPFQKIWRYSLYHRNRFHLASLGWKAGAGIWPVLCFAGREMLENSANMPGDTILKRRAQEDLLFRHAPDLAALPLDRNSRTNLAPVRYRSKWQKRWDEKVLTPYRRLRLRFERRRGIESRYYYRVYDINHPGWRAIREAAEPYRALAETYLEPEALRKFVPPPNAHIRMGDGIVDVSKAKTLIGFMLWAGKNLSTYVTR